MFLLFHISSKENRHFFFFSLVCSFIESHWWSCSHHHASHRLRLSNSYSIWWMPPNACGWAEEECIQEELLFLKGWIVNSFSEETLECTLFHPHIWAGEQILFRGPGPAISWAPPPFLTDFWGLEALSHAKYKLSWLNSCSEYPTVFFFLFFFFLRATVIHL